MIARIAVWEPMPDDDRQWVIDAAKAVPGVRDAYHPVDPNTGNGLSIVCRWPRTTGTAGGSVPALKACAGQSLRFR